MSISTISPIAGMCWATVIPPTPASGVPYFRRNTSPYSSVSTSPCPSLKKTNYKQKKTEYEKSNDRCLGSYASCRNSNPRKSTNPEQLPHRSRRESPIGRQYGWLDGGKQQIRPHRRQMGRPVGSQLLRRLFQRLYLPEGDGRQTQGSIIGCRRQIRQQDERHQCRK